MTFRIDCCSEVDRTLVSNALVAAGLAIDNALAELRRGDAECECLPVETAVAEWKCLCNDDHREIALVVTELETVRQSIETVSWDLRMPARLSPAANSLINQMHVATAAAERQFEAADR